MAKLNPVQRSRQVSETQIAMMALRCLPTLMSVRMPRIPGLLALGGSHFLDHGLKALVTGVELGLKFGRISPIDALHDLLINSHYFLTVLLNIADRHFDLPRAEVELVGDQVAVPS